MIPVEILINMQQLCFYVSNTIPMCLPTLANKNHFAEGRPLRMLSPNDSYVLMKML